ncbi:hypothetical protein [Aquipuribacter nitratireducens]|uniref:Uncharacterized protein n=1 Tax=Aquipuribacter nitratireducens TaxID=650104 RepID=A0ABW0GJW8_9MICO
MSPPAGRNRWSRPTTTLTLAVLATLALAGCVTTPTDPTTGGRGDARVVPSLDGEFISRRAAVAVAVDPDTDREPVEDTLLDVAATLGHEPRLTYAAVLRPDRPGDLPEVTLLLEEGTSDEDAQHVLDELGARSGVSQQQAVTVYAHDLVLSVGLPDAVAATAAADAVALEAILADALGFHELDVDGRRLVVRYVGPLLPRNQLDSAVLALSRATGAPAAQVRIDPGTPGDPVAWAEVDDPFADVRRLQAPGGHGHTS